MSWWARRPRCPHVRTSCWICMSASVERGRRRFWKIGLASWKQLRVGRTHVTDGSPQHLRWLILSGVTSRMQRVGWTNLLNFTFYRWSHYYVRSHQLGEPEDDVEWIIVRALSENLFVLSFFSFFVVCFMFVLVPNSSAPTFIVYISARSRPCCHVSNSHQSRLVGWMTHPADSRSLLCHLANFTFSLISQFSCPF